MGVKIVPPIGPLDCKIAFIGEAPGEEEVRQGEPFVGRSGELLTHTMHSLGILRRDVYITNVIKERPERNDIRKFIILEGKEPKITPEYIKYEQELYKELDECTANVLVAVGNIALFALTGKRGIMKWRGSILHSPLGKVIPIIHPAAALRMYDLRYRIQMDLKRVKEESEFPDLRLPQRDIYIGPSTREACNYLASIIQDATPVGFDIEVMNQEVSCLSFAKSPFDVMSIPFVANGGGQYFTVGQEVEIWNIISHILEDKNIKIVGQNINFDASFMLRKFGMITNNIEDTMVAQGIAYPEFPKGLDFIASMYTREPYYKDDGKQWYKGFGDNIESFWRYNALDSAVCLEAYYELMEELEEQGNVETYRKQTDLIYPLLFIQERGIKVDRDVLEDMKDVTEEEIEELERELNEVTGCDLNINSHKQMCTYFYIEKGVKPYTKKGAMTVDETALKRLLIKGFKEAGIILSLRGKKKLLSTYLNMTFDEGDRFRSVYNPVGTTSGRLSSSKTIFGTGGNAQNIPKAIRHFLTVDEGYVMYNIDLSQAENRVTAYIAPELTMIEAFETGVDVHSLTASMIFDIPIEEVSNEDGSCDVGTGAFSQRSWGKKANHGLNYGLGPDKFALLNEVSISEAKFVIGRYFAMYPGIKQYHSWVKNEIYTSRRLTNCLGRSRNFMGRTGTDLLQEAYSFIPQSTVADKTNDALAYIYRDQDTFKYVELLNQMHDSIVIQNPVKRGAEEHARCLMDIVNRLQTPITWKNTTFSIPAEVGIGWNMRDFHKLTFTSLDDLTEQIDLFIRKGER